MPPPQQQSPYEMGGAVGGYNFQRIMEDHFEHYKRPASRERSVDKTNLPVSLAEANPRGRSGSRQPMMSNHNPSSTTSSRVPSLNRGGAPLPYTDMDLDLRRKELEAKFLGNGDLHNEPKEDTSLRFRGQPSQEISQLGTVPKRTESLYKPLDSKGKVSSNAW